MLITPDFDGNIDLWDIYRIPVLPNVQNTYCHYGMPSSEKPDWINYFEIRHYRLTAQMQKLIQSQTNSLFSWTCYYGYHNPDDLAFYRADGSVFFSSVVHEGECTFYLRENEDLSDILSQEHKMDRAIYFNHDDQHRDRCTGAVYRRFLDYAFARTDFFMLVYANYEGRGYTNKMKSFLQELKPFQVKRRSNPSWPGTPATYCPNTTYKIVFYKNCAQTKEILEKVDCLSAWTRPFYPQDLAFFKGNQCWFYSVGHEKITQIIHATDEDISFLEENGLANREDAYIPKNNWFDTYDEFIPRD